MTARCTHWMRNRWCEDPETREYLTGPRCSAHTPAALVGRPECVPDPNRTLDALRATKGQAFVFRLNDSAINDQRAIASGRRRSNPEQYRAAQRAEQERKAKP